MNYNSENKDQFISSAPIMDSPLEFVKPLSGYIGKWQNDKLIPTSSKKPESKIQESGITIFNKLETKGWNGKVNFVDSNNVLLGYDMESSCCEDYGWYILDRISTKIPEGSSTSEKGTFEMLGWTFDTSFIVNIDNSEGYDSNTIVAFKIVNGDQEKFIHLYNIHNGYYSHGFTFLKDGFKIKEGSI